MGGRSTIFHEDKKVRIYFQEMNEEFSIVCAQFGVEEITGKIQLSNLPQFIV